MQNPEISSIRAQIDEIDDELLALINKRGELSLKIRSVKKQTNVPILDEEREAQVIERLVKKNFGPISDEQVGQIFQSLMEQMRAIRSSD